MEGTGVTQVVVDQTWEPEWPSNRMMPSIRFGRFTEPYRRPGGRKNAMNASARTDRGGDSGPWGSA